MLATETATTGYLHADYAGSLSEFGSPRLLTGSNGWILKRQIPEQPEWDAMGCYPLFSCENWLQLDDDLDELEGKIVSLSVVTDPFGDYNEAFLQRCFGTVVLPFKQHFVTDLSRPIDSFISKHHRRNAQKSGRHIEVEACEKPQVYADEWFDLYESLISRHDIHGIAEFSRAALRLQLAVPGMIMLRATHAGETVGMLLWYVQQSVAYYHLGAYTERGYELRASFALFRFAIEYFATRIEWLALGAGAGTDESKSDGLTRFKNGWATGTRTAYFCGRIYDPKRYAELTTAKGATKTTYFPAYRAGEFS